MITGDRVTVVDADSVPTGEIRPVDSTPLDFRTPTRIGARIDAAHDLLKFGQGYDLNWCLPGSGLRLAAVARSHNSGRVLSCYTDQPAVQFYSGNYIGRGGDIKGKGGAVYRDRSGFCLETQHYPDSPNHAHFPSTVLRPGEVFRSTTVYTIAVS
jgi:aldose 1-epimerase